MAEVCVIGAGPAGCVFATRMGALGHSVRLLEQAPFPRSRLGESLTPGVGPLLQAAGLARALDGPHARPAAAARVSWEGPERLRDFGGAGWIVERGGFDAALLAGARSAGVEAHVPARALSWARRGGRWRVEVAAGARRETLEADFIADARGRGGGWKRGAARTVALYAYARPAEPPRSALVAALDDGWAWGVPLPGGLYNAIVFLDASASRAAADILAERWRSRAARAGLLADVGDAASGEVRAIDATPYLAAESVGPDHVVVGDRALALDPLSSSGVQKAVQGALAAAVVAHTLLRRPERAQAAMAFHRARLAAAARRHAAWAGAHYAAAGREGPFWAARACAAPAEPEPLALGPEFLAGVPVSLSPRAEWRDTPCLEEDFVAMAPALAHPNLPEPVAYLGGEALAPLLRGLEGGRTSLELARGWRLPLETGLGIAAWLAARGVLEPSRALRARA